MIVIMLPQYADHDTTDADTLDVILAQHPELKPTVRHTDNDNGCFLYGLVCTLDNMPSVITDTVFDTGGATWESDHLSATPPGYQGDN